MVKISKKLRQQIEDYLWVATLKYIYVMKSDGRIYRIERSKQGTDAYFDKDEWKEVK